MISRINILFFGVLTIFAVMSSSSLVALHSSAHVLQLYLKLRNEDPPSKTDPVISRVQAPERICDDIGDSGFFQLVGFSPISMDGVYPERSASEGSNEADENHEKHLHPYKLREFNVLDSVGSHDFNEYVFECAPLKDFFIIERPMIFYHVSKEYNVSPLEEWYKPGRFVFANLIPELQTSYNYMILAEEPVSAYTTPGFNIELHYLQIRKHIDTAKNNDDDPLCKHISVIIDDPRNQYVRFCVAVSRPSTFKRAIAYPDHVTEPCFEEEISFQTEEGLKEAAEKLYYERMILCTLNDENSDDDDEEEEEEGEEVNDDKFLFISRSYLTNAIFVYRRDPSNNKIYLKNLSTNISIVDELNSFDFVEY